MLEPQFDKLRSGVGDAVRQPGFGTVRRRAGRVRRRRAVTSGAVFLATVLMVTGLGYIARGGPEHRRIAGPAPATSGAPQDVWPRLTSATAAGPELYGILAACPECDLELYVSSDGGENWHERVVPPAPPDAGTPRSAVLVSLAPGVVAWRERRGVPIGEALTPESPAAGDLQWITSDGGRTWRQASVGTSPTTAAADGTRPVACELLAVSTCAVGVIDPATGRFAPLAGQPTGITVRPGWTGSVSVPLDGRLWVSGLDPATSKPAVASSADAGRSWRVHVFTDGVAAGSRQGRTDPAYLPRVAAGSGAIAYVLTYRADDVFDAHYTTDGGLTWRTGDTLRGVPLSAGFVTADGAHIVETATGTVAARGTGRYTRVTLPGYPPDPAQTIQVTTRQAAERYLVTSRTVPYLSADGRTWRRAHLP